MVAAEDVAVEERKSRDAAAQAAIPDLVAALRQAVSDYGVAAITRSQHLERVEEWAAGKVRPSLSEEASLRAGFAIELFLTKYLMAQGAGDRDSAVRLVGQWMTGSNPNLGNRSPAMVLSHDPDAVRRAAYSFVAGDMD